MDFDGPYKKLFSNPEMIADLIKTFVHEDWVATLDFTTLELVNSSFIGDAMERREGDLVFKVQNHNKEPSYLLLLLELQSSNDYWMAVRFMTYVGLLYQQLIKDKQVTRKSKLPPVFPLVLYNGNSRWTAPVHLETLIRPPQDSTLERYQPRLRYYIIDENDALDALGTSLSNLLFRLEKNKDKQTFEQRLIELIKALQASHFKHLNRDLVAYLRHVCDPIIQMELDFDSIEDIIEGKTMLKENIQIWSQEYYEEGKEEGRQEGKEEARQNTARLLVSLLTKRFEALTSDEIEIIQHAQVEDLNRWMTALFDATSIQDLLSR